MATRSDILMAMAAYVQEWALDPVRLELMRTQPRAVVTRFHLRPLYANSTRSSSQVALFEKLVAISLRMQEYHCSLSSARTCFKDSSPGIHIFARL